MGQDKGERYEALVMYLLKEFTELRGELDRLPSELRAHLLWILEGEDPRKNSRQH
jgi:hypothetical protein